MICNHELDGGCGNISKWWGKGVEAFGNANATTFSGVKAVNLTVSGPCGTTLYVWLELVGRVGTSEWKWVFTNKR